MIPSYGIIWHLASENRHAGSLPVEGSMVKIFRRTLLPVLLILSAAIVAVAAAPTTEYKNEGKGFTVRFPATWETRDTDDGVTASAPVMKNQTGAYRANAHVSVEILAQEKTAADYSQTAFQRLQARLAEFRSHRTGRQTINHLPGRWWIVTYRENTTQVKGMLFIVVKGKKAFILLTGAPLEQYTEYKDILGDIGASLNIY